MATQGVRLSEVDSGRKREAKRADQKLFVGWRSVVRSNTKGAGAMEARQEELVEPCEEQRVELLDMVDERMM